MGRKLTDLFVVGKEVKLNDDSGRDPVVVYVKKMNPLLQSNAVKKAAGARARMLAVGSDENVAKRAEQEIEAEEMSREDQVELLIAEDLQKARLSIEAELGAKPEWDDDSFLDGLREAWVELADVYAENPEDPEASRVFGKLKEFEDQVSAKLQTRKKRLVSEHKGTEKSELASQVIDKLVAFEADAEWLREYRRQELFFSVYDEDRKTRHFDSPDDVSSLNTEILRRLIAEIQSVTVESMAGKSLEEAPNSSNS